MRRLGAWILIGAVGLALGLGSAVLAIQSLDGASSVRNGAWQVSTLAGSPEADPYTRAAVALGGLLALAPSEALYFIARRDDAGDRLTTRCDYAILGGDVEGAWWSLTAYGADRFLIANPIKRHSFNGGGVERETDGTWVIHAAPEAKAGNWLPTGSGTFYLALRVYRPGASVRADPGHVALPQIRRETCR